MVNNTTDIFDSEFSNKILKRINSGENCSSAIKVKDIPSFENKSIINMSEQTFTVELDLQNAENNLKHYTDMVKLRNYGIISMGKAIFDRKDLEDIGLYLLPLVSVGILNGGAATSYTDSLKNSSFSSGIYEACYDQFYALRELYKNSPKGNYSCLYKQR